MVEISKALEYADFNSFDRVRFPKIKFVGLMQYDGDLKLPANYLVPLLSSSAPRAKCWPLTVSRRSRAARRKSSVTSPLLERQPLRLLSESLETYVEIPSDNVPFNQAPLMKAREITAAGKEALKSGKYDVVRVNYANPDMVGHT